MFLCAQARPRFDTSSNSWWDGKLGIWPIGHVVNALRNSVNHPAGTPGWENLTITRPVYRSRLIDKLLPAILAKWHCSKDEFELIEGLDGPEETQVKYVDIR